MDKIFKEFTLEFLGSGKHKISPELFFELDNAILLDVRTKEETKSIAINLSYYSNIEYINIPLNELPTKVSELPKNKDLIIFCPGKIRASIAYPYLLSQGISNVRIFDGTFADITNALKPGKILKNIKKQ